MNIAGFDVFSYRVDLVAPFLVKGHLQAWREGHLVRIRAADGAEGWGDAAPLPGFSGETSYDVAEALAENRTSLLADAWPDDLNGQWPNALNALPPAARFGVESAWWFMRAAQKGVSPATLLTDSPGATVSVNALLAGEHDEIIARAQEIKAAGYRCVKIKVGRRTPVDDAKIVAAVAQALGGGVAIRVDANRSWDLSQAKEFGTALTGVSIDYVEEPLKNVTLLPQLAGSVSYPIALDETLSDTPLPVWEAWPGLGAIVLKPTILGGVARVSRMATRAAAKGIKAVVSSSFESGVGLAALVQLAAAFGRGETPAGLDTYRWLASDVLVERLPLTGPSADVAAVQANAVRVDESKLRQGA